jgi:hypothetical protein
LSPVIITGLANGTDYSVSLRAVNSLGGGSSAQVPDILNDLSTTPFTIPSKVGSISLTAGDSTDTFSWNAPAKNGRDISKYGFQVSSDNGSTWRSTVNGTLNGETEVLTNSATITTQYKESSYKIRVRAYNEGGWGDYSDISTSGTVAWYKGNDNANSYTSQTVYENQSCTSVNCGSCGLQAQQKTRSKEQRKYRFFRTGSTPGPYDANWTDYTSYPDWSTISCANTGSCVESSWTAVTTGPTAPASFVADGVEGASTTYTRFEQTNDAGNGTGSYYYFVSAYYDANPPFGSNDPICGCSQHHSYTAEYCSNSNSYRAVDEDICRRYRALDSCGGGSK